ncbi:hypothetical protein CEXT_656931 [Caerostris extrusa]|uniref:Uncharacterized protein n=1 Tax=Caerostris extrusa TaxID=172846 RepID=A0AAV4T9A8_CAEEX|nr:hypothetical protein CEXT_656931 [Caerostris extrusa]
MHSSSTNFQSDKDKSEQRLLQRFDTYTTAFFVKYPTRHSLLSFYRHRIPRIYKSNSSLYINKGLSSLQSWTLHVENKFSSSIFDSSHLFEEENVFSCVYRAKTVDGKRILNEFLKFRF